MNENNDILKTIGAEAFFSIVNGEIFVWEALQKAFQTQGVLVGVGRFIPLLYLADGPLRLQELVALTHAKQSAASRLVERMVKDGLVEKRRDGSDGRAVLLHITAEGRRVEAEACAVFARCVDELFADLNVDELKELCSLLSRLKRSEEPVVCKPDVHAEASQARSPEAGGRVANRGGSASGAVA